jgi:hypothetical protein
MATLTFIWDPNPVPPGNPCGAAPPGSKSWNYTITIQNNNNVDFVISTFTTNYFPTGQSSYSQNRTWGLGPIPAFGSQKGADCTYFFTAPSGTQTYTFVGTFGTFTTPVLTLSP